jgi:hypothetical protein
MNIILYRQYLQQFVQEAIDHSDGTNAGIASYLGDKQIKGFLVQHREEKQRALRDAKQAFDDHRHWPMDIVLSHLGVTLKEQNR